MLSNCSKLTGIDFVGSSGFSLVKLFSDARHNLESVVKSLLYLSSDNLVRFAEDVSPL